MKPLYRAFGLLLQSDIPLGVRVDTTSQIADVDIVFGKVPRKLKAALKTRPGFDVTESQILLRIPNIGRFLIRDGRTVTVHPHRGATEEALRLYLLGSVCGAVLKQRGFLTLHSSAVTDGKSAILICGRSGNGKSTTSAAMVRHGFRLLSDDVCPISIRQKQAAVTPGYAQIKLWDESPEYGRLMSSSGPTPRQIRHSLPKFGFSFEQNFHSSPLPVHAIVCLNKGDNETVSLSRLSGGNAFDVIRRNTYRKGYLVGGSLKNHWEISTHLLQQVAVYQLARPQYRNSVEAVVAELSDLFQSVRAAA